MHGSLNEWLTKSKLPAFDKYKLSLVTGLSAYLPNSKLDQSLDLFSYPLFLIHQPPGLFLAAHLAHANMFLLLFFGMIAAGALVLLVEKPLDNIRYQVRKCLTLRATG